MTKIDVIDDDIRNGLIRTLSMSLKRKKVKGNTQGVAEHLAKKYSTDPDFSTKCLDSEELLGYSDADKVSICAQAHKIATGKSRNWKKKIKGGKGSGNFGHAGRVGKVGGSSDSDGDLGIYMPTPDLSKIKRGKVAPSLAGKTGWVFPDGQCVINTDLYIHSEIAEDILDANNLASDSPIAKLVERFGAFQIHQTGLETDVTCDDLPARFRTIKRMAFDKFDVSKFVFLADFKDNVVSTRKDDFIEANGFRDLDNRFAEKGGHGSGNFGHSGRVGKVGGSAPSHGSLGSSTDSMDVNGNSVKVTSYKTESPETISAFVKSKTFLLTKNGFDGRLQDDDARILNQTLANVPEGVLKGVQELGISEADNWFEQRVLHDKPEAINDIDRVYGINTDNAILLRKLPKDLQKATMFVTHEIGHSALENSKKRGAWYIAYRNPDFDRTTAYSKVKDKEGFAETFAAFVSSGGVVSPKAFNAEKLNQAFDVVRQVLAYYDTKKEWSYKSRLKGGKGSDNFGHAGRPGEIGGSAPDGGGLGADKKSSFNRAEWESMDVGARNDKFKALSVQEQDALADAGKSIPSEIANRLKPYGERPSSGDIEKDISSRLQNVTDSIPADSSVKINNAMLELSSALDLAKVDPVLKNKIIMDALDAVIVQENESLSRTLGDHGINHIYGNIETAMGVLKAVPGADTAEAVASVYLSCLYHDTGYLTQPAQSFLDSAHARWSQENFDMNVRTDIASALGEREARQISNIIATHASSDIDWENDATGSAVRLADNLAVFHNEKLPGVFRYAPDNINVLEEFSLGKIDAIEAQTKMSANISALKLSDTLKSTLNKAIKEVNPRTPKFTLGMLGGNIDSFDWKDNHLVAYLRKNTEATRLNRVSDFGQRQFAKLAESYNMRWETLKNSLGFVLPSKVDGSILLEAIQVGEKELKTLIYDAMRHK